ncbi:uncharacterized protein LOC142322979 [Lycorma delicatula]|uniref:uncharacterized protein LOC142322979 n=1 Tax=Lycorma delicatula TaxID=130591 RepID=UPI003F51A60D
MLNSQWIMVLKTDSLKEVALKIICNKEDFPLQLARICDIHTTHGPVYHTLSEDPMYVVQCYALGFKATGSHHRLAIARRVAAKKLLDSIPFDVSLESKHKQKTCIKEKKLNKKLASKRKN